MCGIAGILNLNKLKSLDDIFSTMLSALSHRGPDDQGYWLDKNIGLAHTRLSILDLSSAGHQPMSSFSDRWMIVFNGEIYNFHEIKKSILKEILIDFRGNSDTEIMINAIELWGMKKALEKAIGMFALAAWDKKEKKLYLARDRFGEKPLYYGFQNNLFAFASELKALKPLSTLGWQFDVNRDVLATYMRYGYVPTPYSIYNNVKKLEPSNYLEVDQNGIQTLHRFWNPKEIVSSPIKFTGSYNTAVDQLENLLKDSVRLQMVSDVPVGAFLSGGIDSSIVTALMQSISSKKIRTFSIGFYDPQCNEAVYAKKVSEHIGTDHTEVYVTEKDALSVIPYLPTIYDEPFADSSQIPTFLLTQIAKSQVTVALSGDAGDELFGGYVRYLVAQTLKSKVIDRAFIRHMLSVMPIKLLSPAGFIFNKYANFSDKLIKLQNIIRNTKSSSQDFYRQICSQFYTVDFVHGGNEIDIYTDKNLRDMGSLSFQEWMMYADSQTYLTDDILTKVDRAAMANSLETRVPFLDHRLYEFAWSLPLDYKIHQGIGKRIVRDVLYRYVPQKIIDRPKKGFGIPLGKWLRNELRPWAETLLDSSKIAQQGYFDSKIIQQYWREHVSGKRNWEYALWNVLMFQAWLDQND